MSNVKLIQFGTIIQAAETTSFSGTYTLRMERRIDDGALVSVLYKKKEDEMSTLVGIYDGESFKDAVKALFPELKE